MRPHSRANGAAFRRAVWASVAIHVVAACALVLFVRNDKRAPAEVALDTRATSEPQVRMSFPEAELSLEPPPAKPQAAEPVPPVAAPEVPPPEPVAPQEPGPSSPLAVSRAAPQTLPSELLALIRKPVAQPTETPGGTNPSVVDPNVKPAGGVSGSAVPAIHGALNPNQTAVYVLDCSGSMGAAGKFEMARAALVSTLKLQPTSVRFQVVVYSGTATALLTGNGTALPATEANVRAATDALAKLEARGKSNHPGAVRAALAFHPDVILMLTDADDLNAKALKSIAASAPKAILMCVGQVTAEGVQSPRELK